MALEGLAAGQRADFVVVDANHLTLSGLPAEQALAAHVLASERASALAQTWVGVRVWWGRGGTPGPTTRDWRS